MTPHDNADHLQSESPVQCRYLGQGQTIALVEDTDTYGRVMAPPTGTPTARPSAWRTFPLGSYIQIHPGCADPGTNGDDGEAAIDVEVASAIAPSATIELIACASGTFTFGGLIALQNLMNAAGPYPGVVSMSYGVCEAFTGNGATRTSTTPISRRPPGHLGFRLLGRRRSVQLLRLFRGPSTTLPA